MEIFQLRTGKSNARYPLALAKVNGARSNSTYACRCENPASREELETECEAQEGFEREIGSILHLGASGVA